MYLEQLLEVITSTNMTNWLDAHCAGLPSHHRHPLCGHFGYIAYNSVMYGDTPEKSLQSYSEAIARFWVAHPRMKVKFDRWFAEDRLLRYMYMTGGDSFVEEINRLHAKGHRMTWIVEFPGGIRPLSPSYRYSVIVKFMSSISNLKATEVMKCCPAEGMEGGGVSNHIRGYLVKYIPGISLTAERGHPGSPLFSAKMQSAFQAFVLADLKASAEARARGHIVHEVEYGF